MKSVATTLFSLLLLSVLISSHLPSTTAETVHDTNGKPLKNGVAAYYILPTTKEIFGGGIELAKVGNETCPLSVVLTPTPFSNGAPLTITSPYTIDVIDTGLPVKLSFTSVPICSKNSSMLTIVEDSVKNTGDEKDPVDRWFKIEKHDFFYYKLVFCTGYHVCRDIGIHINDDGIATLVLNQWNENNPSVITFKKAHDISFATDA